MLKVLNSALLVGSFVVFARPASAQHHPAASTSSANSPKYELGADLATQFVSRGDGVGGAVQLGAPVDLRVGFLSKSPLSFEVRASFAYDSKGTGTDATFTFAPGVNALYALKRGTGTHGLMGAPYLTGGLGMNLTKFGAAGTDTQFGLGGGIGTRLQAGGGGLAWRPEGYMTYAFKSGNLPSAFAIGVRMGLSFWH